MLLALASIARADDLWIHIRNPEEVVYALHPIMGRAYAMLPWTDLDRRVAVEICERVVRESRDTIFPQSCTVDCRTYRESVRWTVYHYADRNGGPVWISAGDRCSARVPDSDPPMKEFWEGRPLWGKILETPTSASRSAIMERVLEEMLPMGGVVAFRVE